MQRADQHPTPLADTAVDDVPPRREMTDEEAAEWTRNRIRGLPPEVGAVLVGVGVMGFVFPGPVGAPLVLAGGLVLIPRVFDRLECWLQKKFPKSHRLGMQYVDRFIDDYEKRFPQDWEAQRAASPGASSPEETGTPRSAA
jgi:hypothetical protein